MEVLHKDNKTNVCVYVCVRFRPDHTVTVGCDSIEGCEEGGGLHIHSVGVQTRP